MNNQTVNYIFNITGNANDVVNNINQQAVLLNKTLSGTFNIFSGFRGASVAFQGLTSAVQNVQSAIGGITEVGANAELQLMNMKTLFQGNSEAAADMYKRISQYGKVTPYDKAGLIDAQKTMMSFGIEGEKAFATLKQIGDIAMGDKQKMQSLSLAFAQMSSTGKLMGQDLLQMINAGFNPLNEISKMTGKSVAVLKEEMSKGAISADMVSQAFASATAEGGLFYKAIDEASQTTAGKMASIQDTIDEIKVSIFKATGDLGLWINAASQIAVPLAQLAPLVNITGKAFSLLKSPIIKAYTTLGMYNGYLSIGKVENLGFRKNVIQSAVALGRFSTVGLFNAIKGLGAYGLSLITGGALSKNFALIGGASFKSLSLSAKMACKAIGTAIHSIPVIGWVIAVITAIITAVTLLWKKCEGFRRVVMGVWEVIKYVLGSIWQFAGRVFGQIANVVKQSINGIVTAIKWMYDGAVAVASAIGNFFAGIWHGIRDTVGTVIDWILDKLAPVGTWIKEKFIEPIANAFRWLKEFVKGIFRSIRDIYDKTIGAVIDWVGDMFRGSGEGVKEAYKRGAEKGSESYRKDHKEPEEDSADTSVLGSDGINNSANITPTGTLNGGNMGSSAGTSAGKAQQINITLKSMVETMNFNGGMKENARDVEAQLTAMMARILGMAETAI